MTFRGDGYEPSRREEIYVWKSSLVRHRTRVYILVLWPIEFVRLTTQVDDCDYFQQQRSLNNAFKTPV